MSGKEPKPYKLEIQLNLLMGWIVVPVDSCVEAKLHRKYKEKRGNGEWFSITFTEVLDELRRADGFVPVQENSFEIVSYDKDAVPEYLGVCEWDDFEFCECCPFCGCLAGMHEQGCTGMHYCMNCQAYTNFDFLDGPGEPD